MNRINTDAIRREQAALLRENGIGYKRIVSQTGLTMATVRWMSKSIEPQCESPWPDAREFGKELCVFCGAEMEQPEGAGRRRRFCSDYCRRQYWRLHRQEQKKNPGIIFTRVCRYCGQPFEIYGKNDRKYCCREHYLKHFWGEDVHLNPADEGKIPAI